MSIYNSDKIRKLFIDYWKSNPRNHKEIPNLSLVPNNDSTLLFVNSGMFPLVPYLAGQKHPLGNRLCNIQHCLRPKYEEVLEIGDSRHTIMFEMMGNWSLGDFDKTDQIPWIMEFYVNVAKLDPSRIYVTVFKGNQEIDRDDIAIRVWKETFRKYGIEAEYCEDIYLTPRYVEESKNHKYRIFPYDKDKNWWQRGEAKGELGGPSSEIFYDLGQGEIKQEKYHINDDSGRFIEIGNNVFMEYFLDENLKWKKLTQRNIDFGGGFERLIMCMENKNDMFETDLFIDCIKKIEDITGKKYKDEKENTIAFRVLADHARASTFIIADGITPSNKDQGYILRRFIRRMVRFGRKLNINDNFTHILADVFINRMGHIYTQLLENKDKIIETIKKEEINFNKTLNNGLKEIEKIKIKKENIDGKKAFYIYETYGYPIEMTLEELNISISDGEEIIREFKENQKIHKENSRRGAEMKFKGGLADHSVEVTKLHTTHHLLLASLKKNISKDIKQRGSNITGERLRLDFNFDRKLNEEELISVENDINLWINMGLKVERLEMSKTEAEKIGAEMEFNQKYPDMVSIYKITDNFGNKISLEFCGGPHVKNTNEIGESNKKIKLYEHENIGGGIKRIKAKLINKDETN